MKNLLNTFVILLIFCLDSYALTITQDSTKIEITDAQLRQKLQLFSIAVQDPVYKKIKHYGAWRLLDILDLAQIHPALKNVLEFTAQDGYKAHISFADIFNSKAQAFVAVKDLDAPRGWESFEQGKQKMTPAPYYLVWQSSSQVPAGIKLPWPYQMVSIDVIDNGIYLDKLFPDNKEQNPSIARGYKIFTQNCLSCHSLNLEGGVLGPELNVPRNVLEYRDRNTLKEFISNPGSFRAKDKMPAFNTTLSSQSIDEVLDYLAWMGKHKIAA